MPAGEKDKTPQRAGKTNVDARGRTMDDASDAVAAEVTEYGAHGRLRRARFFLDRADLPWLPVGEAAFLLWVLVALLVLWASIGFTLRFT
jgi:hypothetical protein